MVVVPGLSLPGVAGVDEQKRAAQSVPGSGVVLSHSTAPLI